MSCLEKQDLVYFWTGSPALPASEEGFQPMPTVTIRYSSIQANASLSILTDLLTLKISKDSLIFFILMD
jgi:hypothetical protein